MKTLEVSFADDLIAQLEEVARERGISLEELVRVSTIEKLERDAQFEAAADYVVTKNGKLYERLS